MTDIGERLRKPIRSDSDGKLVYDPLRLEAATEIDRLRAEIELAKRTVARLTNERDALRDEIERLRALLKMSDDAGWDVWKEQARETDKLRSEIERLQAALDQRRVVDQCILDEAIKVATKGKDAEIARLRDLYRQADDDRAEDQQRLFHYEAEIARLTGKLAQEKGENEPKK